MDGSLWLSWSPGRFNSGRKVRGTHWWLGGTRKQSGEFEDEKNMLPVLGVIAGMLGCQFLAQTLWRLRRRSSVLVTVHLLSILCPCVWRTPVRMNLSAMSKPNVDTEPTQPSPSHWTPFLTLFIHRAASQQTSRISVLIFNLDFRYFVVSYFESVQIFRFPSSYDTVKPQNANIHIRRGPQKPKGTIRNLYKQLSQEIPTCEIK